MCPQNKKRGQVAHLSKPATSGTQNSGEPSAHGGWAKLGARGAKPPWQGVWGMCPQNKKRGQVAHISKPATSGAQNSGEPSAHGGGQNWGPGGEAPMAGGLGDVPPEQNEGASSPP